MIKKIMLNFYLDVRKTLSRGNGFGQYVVVRKILYYIEHYLKSDFTMIQGSKMFLGEGDPLNISIEGVWEESSTKIFKNSINEGDIVVDVGASIGYFTLLAAKLVGNKGKVFAFEPGPENFKILKKNVEVNKYDNVILEQKSVSDINGKINLNFTDHIGFHSTDFSPDDPVCLRLPTTSITLDKYFENLNLIGKLNFIKMDVEGGEFKVLSGMRTILKQQKNLKILAEFMKDFLIQVGSDPKEMLSLLDHNGFTLFNIDDKNQKLYQTNIDELMHLEELDSTVNIFCEKLDDNLP